MPSTACPCAGCWPADGNAQQGADRKKNPRNVDGVNALGTHASTGEVCRARYLNAQRQAGRAQLQKKVEHEGQKGGVLEEKRPLVLQCYPFMYFRLQILYENCVCTLTFDSLYSCTLRALVTAMMKLSLPHLLCSCSLALVACDNAASTPTGSSGHAVGETSVTSGAGSTGESSIGTTTSLDSETGDAGSTSGADTGSETDTTEGSSGTGVQDDIAITGRFLDGFGGMHSIDNVAWLQEGEGYRSVFHMVSFDNDAAIAVFQNDAANGFAPGLFSRFEWVLGDNDSVWYCQIVYDAASAELALEAPAPDPTDLEGMGCAGFAWTSMRRL